MPSQKFDVLDGLELTGSIQIDNNLLVANTVTSKVGFGTATPAEKIEVVGNVKTDGLIIDSPAAQATEATSLMINASGVVGTRELGSLAFSSATYDNYSSWTIRDGDTTTYTVTSGDTLQIVGGTVLTSNFTADDVLTINHNDVTRSNTSTTDAPAYGATFTALKSITTSAQGHVTGVQTTTVTIPASDNTDTKQTVANITGTGSVNYYPTMMAAAGNSEGVIDTAGLSFNTGTNTLTVGGTVSTTTVSATNVNVADFMIHTGDTDTYVGFNAADSFNIVTGATSRARANNSGFFVFQNLDVGANINAATIGVEDYFTETVYAAPSGTSYNMNLANGSVHTFTPTAAASIDFSGFPDNATTAAAWTLVVNNNGTARALTWPDAAEADAVYWADSIEPTPSAGIDIYTFIIIAGQIYGSMSARNCGFAQ